MEVIDVKRIRRYRPRVYRVIIAPLAQSDFDALPVVIRLRVLVIFERLALWPDVSGTKPLRHGLKGLFRIRTGVYRVVFTVDVGGETVTVTRIDNRKDVYR